MSLVTGYIHLQGSKLPQVLSAASHLNRLILTLIHAFCLDCSAVKLTEESTLRGNDIFFTLYFMYRIYNIQRGSVCVCVNHIAVHHKPFTDYMPVHKMYLSPNIPLWVLHHQLKDHKLKRLRSSSVSAKVACRNQVQYTLQHWCRFASKWKVWLPVVKWLCLWLIIYNRLT